MMAHSNYGAALKTSGVEVTLIYSGDHKVDGNPYEKLPKEVRADFQARIDATRQMFAEKVAGYTGMSVQAVLDTEAAVFSGQESVDNGLAEQLVNNMDALNVMRDAINKRTMISRGGSMKGTTASADTTQPAASADQTVTTVDVPATVVTDPEAGATVDISSQAAAAVAAENGRIMGILNCEEAKGRESQARVLAETPGMTVESAQRILAAAPQSAQARTDTALDRLMETAPGTVTAGSASAEAGDDLLNTPV
ncbi:S49 family peptidase [Citrobacter freundii]